MPDFPFHFLLGVFLWPGQNSIEFGESGQIGQKRRTIFLLLFQRPAPKLFVGLVAAAHFSSPPAHHIPEKMVYGFGRVFGAKRLYDCAPMTIVELLLLLLRETHQQPVLDLFTLGERASGGVQTLENLLRIVGVVKADADYPEPLESP